MGDYFNAAWNVATAPARAAVAVAVAGVKAEAWLVTQEVKAAEWLAKQTVKAAVATGKAVADAAVATGKAIADAAVATGKAIAAEAVATYDGAKWLAQGVWESFTGGPKGFVCIPCMVLAAENAELAADRWLDDQRKALVFRRDFAAFQGQQLRICSAGGEQTIERVNRKPDGTYEVTGTVTPDKDNGTWTTKDVAPHPVPTPNVSHVNGIQNTPYEGLDGAKALQSALHAKCKGKSPGDAGCPECDCVLYTYSEFLGVGMDLVQCLGAKLGWNGKVTDEEAQMMRDAVRTGQHLTLSAHSRGSILTENAWDKVYGELRDQNMNNPEVKAAGDQAFDETMEETADPLAADIARDDAERRVAGDEAAATLNQNVKVVSSGNAVSHYNSREEGTRVISTWHGFSVDLVNAPTGSSHFGKMKTVRQPIPADDSLLGMHHNFNKYYATPVADEIGCGGDPPPR